METVRKFLMVDQPIEFLLFLCSELTYLSQEYVDWKLT